MERFLPIFSTLASAFIGGFIFNLAHLPLPWILGAIMGVIIASKTPLKMAKIPRPIVNVARIIIGLAIGSKFSPEILDDLGQYLTSIAFLPFYIAAVTGCGWVYFHYLMKLDKRTAFLCSTPGGIAELVMVAEDIKANAAQMALIQGIRILVVVYSLPFITGSIKNVDVGQTKQFMPTIMESDLVSVLILGVIGVAGWYTAKSIKLSGAPIIGPMVCAAGLSMAGWLPQEPPDELFKTGQLLLGASIGGVFFGYSSKEMLKTAFKSTGFLVVLGLITALFAILITHVTDFTFLSALLAFAPGGQAETSIVAIALEENTAYVALHHLLRLFVIVSIIPVFSRAYFK
jgi:membrane AbrB-like protein